MKVRAALDIHVLTNSRMRELTSLSLTCETRQFRETKPPNVASCRLRRLPVMVDVGGSVHKREKQKKKGTRLRSFFFWLPLLDARSVLQASRAEFRGAKLVKPVLYEKQKRKRSAIALRFFFGSPSLARTSDIMY